MYSTSGSNTTKKISFKITIKAFDFIIKEAMAGWIHNRSSIELGLTQVCAIVLQTQFNNDRDSSSYMVKKFNISDAN